MFCKHCGKEIDDSIAFCPSCGGAQGEGGGANKVQASISIDTNAVKSVFMGLVKAITHPRTYVSVLKENMLPTTNIIVIAVLAILIPLVSLIFAPDLIFISSGKIFIFRLLSLILFFGGTSGIVFAASKIGKKNFYSEDICPIITLPLVIDFVSAILSPLFIALSPTLGIISLVFLGLSEFIILFNGFMQTIDDFETLPYLLSFSYLLALYLQYAFIFKNLVSSFGTNMFNSFY